FDMGITEGEKIVPIMKSPFGDPTAYLSKGTVIALRESDCSKITVRLNRDYA
ncbi:MAG TPA: ferrous iron transport protein A, partial [Ruminococcaceae bacterium]|nr:ferrous iron transport protein A [Oscillospiraceae bacterium]